MNSKNDGYTPPAQPDENNNDGNNGNASADQIKDFGSITAMNAENPIHCLTIIGQIEGHYILPENSKATKYEHVIPALVAIEEEPAVKGLLVILNTVGGDVEAGLAIAELIAGMKKPVVSLVLGGGHSIGVPLSVAADKSFIVPSATMTVHPVRMTGLVVGVPQTYSYFERMQDRIVRFICDNSKIGEPDLRRMLHNTAELATDIGTVLSGEEAVQCGLIDEIGSLGAAIDCLNDMIKQRESDNDDGAAES